MINIQFFRMLCYAESKNELADKFMNKLFRSFLLFLFASMIVISNAHALNDMTIYAESNGSYTYKDKTYLLDQFPIKEVMQEHAGGDNAPQVDSVVPITVDIFPRGNVDLYLLRELVRPLAVQFHRKGAKVNTRIFNKTIPYLFNKK